MIFDQTEHLNRYAILSKIEKHISAEFQSGKFDIDGDDFFGIGLSYDTKVLDECLWEAHERYIDIHVILEGEERIQVADRANTTVSKAYDKENDYALFHAEAEQEVIMKKGMFLCLYPNEVHKTAIVLDSPVPLKKLVFKIAYK